MQDFYEIEGFDDSLDVSAANRKFQTSIVVKQDPSKSGILNFLSEAEQATVSQPTTTQPSTIRVSGGYP